MILIRILEFDDTMGNHVNASTDEDQNLLVDESPNAFQSMSTDSEEDSSNDSVNESGFESDADVSVIRNDSELLSRSESCEHKSITGKSDSDKFNVLSNPTMYDGVFVLSSKFFKDHFVEGVHSLQPPRS